MEPDDGPIRSCVGCRRRSPAAELLRVVVRAGAVVPDERRRLPGRGAHIHPTIDCLELAVRRRAFARALREPVSDVEAVRMLLDEASKQPGKP